MAIEDFLYEYVAEGEFDYDFYIVYLQTECDDPYYPPYNNNIGIFKSKENAIAYTRKSFYDCAENYTSVERRKYGGVPQKFYIEGKYYKDSDGDVEIKRKVNHDEPLYIIYDKEEQDKIDARCDRMHGKTR